MILLAHWSFDPFVVAVALIAAVHERGLRRLNRHAPPDRARARRRRAGLFYVGLAVLLVAVCSPIDYWSDRYFWMHAVQHLLLLFAAPAAVVAGAPWLVLEHGIPVRPRRRVARALTLDRWAAPLRRLAQLVLHPVTAVVAVNAVVVLWHLPGPFDLAEDNGAVHVLLMHGSFFVCGVLLFLQLLRSPPLAPRLSPEGQMAAIFATACTFWVLAIAMALFSKGPWYGWYKVHEGPLLSPYADQQIGAGIMWICGDFWAIPTMIKAVHRLIEGRPASELRARLDRLRPGARGIRLQGRIHAQLALQEDELERASLARLAARRAGAFPEAGEPGAAGS